MSRGELFANSARISAIVFLMTDYQAMEIQSITILDSGS